MICNASARRYIFAGIVLFFGLVPVAVNLVRNQFITGLNTVLTRAEVQHQCHNLWVHGRAFLRLRIGTQLLGDHGYCVRKELITLALCLTLVAGVRVIARRPRMLTDTHV